MSRKSQAALPLPCAAAPGSDQLSRLTSQLNSYWVDNQNLSRQASVTRSQVEHLQQENIRLHQSFVMECQSHAGTAKELSRLQEQVHRLERLFPGRQEDGLTSVARAFFELEAREAALQQSETEIWGRAKDLAMLCGDIQHEYAQRRRDTTRSVAANQAELIRQQLRYPPQYPPQTTGRG